MEVVTLGVLARLVTTHDVPGRYKGSSIKLGCKMSIRVVLFGLGGYLSLCIDSSLTTIINDLKGVLVGIITWGIRDKKN